MTQGSHEPGTGPAGVAWHNFRDLGGIDLGGGRRVARGRVYRAGVVTGPGSDAAGLGIAAICDLRSISERARRPTPWQALGVRDYWARDHDAPAGDLWRVVRDAASTPADVRATMIALYRSLPFELADAYRATFRSLAAGRVPLVFHCTAGKDRTGVLAALLLAGLGASRATIAADYCRTNDYLDGLRVIAASGGDNGISPALWQPVLDADAAYLDAMFDSVEARCGGTDAYLDGLGVTTAERAAIAGLLVDAG